METKNWLVIEEAEVTHYLFAASPLAEITWRMEELGFLSLDYSGTEYIKDGGNYCFVKQEWIEMGKKYLEIVIKNPEILEKVNFDAMEYGQQLFEYGWELLGRDYSELDNQELGILYDKFEKLHEDAHIRRGVMWILETYNEDFSGYIRGYLAKEIKNQNKSLNADVVFATLSTPIDKNCTTKERENFLNLALKLVEIKNLSDEVIKEKLAEHVEKYCWLPYGITGPAWGEEYFFESMKELMQRSPEEIKNELNELNLSVDKINKQQQEIQDELKIDQLHLRLLKLARDSIQMKAYTKEALFFGYYAAERLFQAMADRLEIEVRLLRHLLPWEVGSALKSGQIDKIELEKRYEYSFHLIHKGETRVFTGDEAREFVKNIKLERQGCVKETVREVKGSCAMPGKVRGKTRIINAVADMGKMNEGDVLVSKMTDPQIIAVMKKAGAIVTDMGGITCHAAIVARELRIPCIIGTKFATQVFKDGDMVEVDAEKGIIRKI